MDSSSSDASTPPSLEELSTRGATALLLPLILRTTAASNSTPREIAVFVHQPTRSITVIEGSIDVDLLLSEIPSKYGPLPASKASIESLPLVQISEPGLECAICLTEYEVNGEDEVKQMPCRHRFHSDCIDKWLGIHGSCPVCRYSMPVEEEKKESEERGRLRGGWRVHMFFAGGGRSSGLVDEDVNSQVGDDGNNESPAMNMGRSEDPDSLGVYDAEEMDLDNID